MSVFGGYQKILIGFVQIHRAVLEASGGWPQKSGRGESPLGSKTEHRSAVGAAAAAAAAAAAD